MNTKPALSLQPIQPRDDRCVCVRACVYGSFPSHTIHTAACLSCVASLSHDVVNNYRIRLYLKVNNIVITARI